LRAVGRGQRELEGGIQQLVTSLPQKDKELPRLACAYGNRLFFRAQRDRWGPHARLLTVADAGCSSTYHITEEPLLSTLDTALFKQLISVLAAPVNSCDTYSLHNPPR